MKYIFVFGLIALIVFTLNTEVRAQNDADSGSLPTSDLKGILTDVADIQVNDVEKITTSEKLTNSGGDEDDEDNDDGSGNDDGGDNDDGDDK
ncbi:hypothetical protein U1Q18_050394 [Sarracenia purpurea var. burkii]